jgi:hypothetical protein
MGGRRRRSVKKSRKMKGGNFYGFAADPQIGSAGAARPSVENLAADPVSGRLIPNNGELNATQLGGRRRRRTGKGKKATRKGKKVGGRRRRTMRGGASYLGSANTGYGYAGTGSGGLADAVGYRSNVPGPGAGQQVNGVWSA